MLNLPKELVEILESQAEREELMRYAAHRARFEVPEGTDAIEAGIDAFSEATRIVLEGRSRWDPDKIRDPRRFLQLVIVRAMRNARKRGGKVLSRTLAFEDAGVREEELPDSSTRPEEADELVLKLLDRMRDDEEACSVIERIVDGDETPRAVAASLNRPASSIYVVKKRIARELTKLMQERQQQ